MKIAIIGASGSIGSALTKKLLGETAHSLVLFSHHAKRLHYSPKEEQRLTHIDGNVLDEQDIRGALKNCDAAVYLVHLMGNQHTTGGFIDAEAQAAQNFSKAVNINDVRRVIYIGGMGSQEDAVLSQHLKSRRQTGDILRSNIPDLIEFRTPMVIGAAAAGFEVLRLFADRYKILPVPKWANAETNPITMHDVTKYIVAALSVPDTTQLSIPISGPERLTYVDVAKRYAHMTQKRLYVIPVPFVSKKLAAYIFKRVFSNHFAITVADMIESAAYSPAIDTEISRHYFPHITPEPIDNAFGTL